MAISAKTNRDGRDVPGPDHGGNRGPGAVRVNLNEEIHYYGKGGTHGRAGTEIPRRGPWS
jgi:hypothetical protein